jgi:hypothetical protein
MNSQIKRKMQEQYFQKYFGVFPLLTASMDKQNGSRATSRPRGYSQFSEALPLTVLGHGRQLMGGVIWFAAYCMAEVV